MHCIQVLIGRAEVLAEAKRRFPSAVPCPLAQGLALVPITDRLVDALEAIAHDAADTLLPKSGEMAPGVAALAAELSRKGPVVYAATFLFGGTGGQDAVVWIEGEVVLNLGDDEDSMSAWPDSPISRALRHIGVVTAKGEDEFDAISLGRYRSNEAWAQQAARTSEAHPG